MSYAESRLLDIGFNPARDYAFFDPLPDENGSKVKRPICWEKENGDLAIGIYDLNRDFIIYDEREHQNAVNYQITHLVRHKDPRIDKLGNLVKIEPEKPGQGVFPLFGLKVTEAYKKGEEIETLIITEGYIKAITCDINGIYCVGLPGITIWKPKETKQIFPQILSLVKKCNVKNLVWLTDADSLKVEWEEGKDLFKRPNSFYTSVRMFKELTLDWGVQQYYAHVVETSLHKGIDDVLVANIDKVHEIKNELYKHSSEGVFIKKMLVSAMTFSQIQNYFGLGDGADGFFKKYENVIGLREFVFNRGVFKYDDDTHKLVYIKAGESSQFVMIDSTYYIKGSFPTLHGNTEIVLKPIKTIGINKMFQNKSKSELARIYSDIDYYNGFINRPAHIDYKKVFKATDREGFEMKFYNKYFELSWNPASGNCDLSINFIKHIFGTGTVEFEGKSYNEYDLGLDYVQLLYTNPMQKLHIVSLVSEQRGTGKTKFWEWMAKIFQQNSKEISSDSLMGQFNSDWSSCLLCYMDEAFIDKKATIERLKSLVTANKAKSEGKFMDRDQVDNFLKIGLSSNDVRNFANISTAEVRFWVREVPPIPEENYDPDFEMKLYAEIPYFLYFLQNRKLVTERRTRSWFADELIYTDALDAVKKESRSGIEISIEMEMREYMSSVGKTVVKLSPKDIREMLADNTLNLAKLRWGMAKFDIPITYNCSYTKYKVIADSMNSNGFTVSEEQRKSAPYLILASKFFNTAELVSLFPKEELMLLEIAEAKIDPKDTWFLKAMDTPFLRDKYLFKELTDEEYSTIVMQSATFEQADLLTDQHLFKSKSK